MATTLEAEATDTQKEQIFHQYLETVSKISKFELSTKEAKFNDYYPNSLSLFENEKDSRVEKWWVSKILMIWIIFFKVNL